jgi:two-component system, NarL family, sensor histidine kinase BarA
MSDLVPLSVLQQRVPLGEVVDQVSFVEVCKSFSDLYRVGVKVFDAHGKRLVDIKAGSEDFCGYVFTYQTGKERCTATVSRVKDQPIPGKDVERIQCFTGARYLVLPIVYEMDYLGRAVLGPFVPDDLVELPSTLLDIGPNGGNGARSGNGFDPTVARALMERFRRAPESTIHKILLHFGTILNVMVFSSYRVFLTGQLHLESVKESNRVLEDKNRELQANFDRLKELDTLKSNFLATVSHELRTPLTSIMGYTDMLLEGLAGPVKDEQQQFLKTIMEKSEALLGMITDMLDLTRAEASRVTLKREVTDPAKILHDTFTTVAPMARKKNIEIRERVLGALPKLPLDRVKVQQSVMNLAVNAIKFTREGGHIVLEGQLVELGDGRFGGDSWLELAVSDDGIGIPNAQIERIFDTFYQVDGSSTREFGGVGLGLALVKSYVEAHGGQVKVHTVEGKGSRFSLLFPTA